MYNYSKRLQTLKYLGVIDLQVFMQVSEDDYYSEDTEETPPDAIRPLEVRNNSGLLCRAGSKERMTFSLMIKTEKRPCIVVFTAEGREKKIFLLKDTLRELAAEATFVKKINSMAEMQEESQTTKPFSNHFWFLSVLEGRLRMWQVGIVTNIERESGFSNYYLSLQLVYSANLYNKNSAVFVPKEHYPGYTEWKDLQLLLKKMVDVSKLRPAEEYSPVPKKEVELGANESEVLWFNQIARYGLGRVSGLSRPAMIHASAINNGEFPSLHNGEIVTFKSLVHKPKGVELIGVSHR